MTYHPNLRTEAVAHHSSSALPSFTSETGWTPLTAHHTILRSTMATASSRSALWLRGILGWPVCVNGPL